MGQLQEHSPPTVVAVGPVREIHMVALVGRTVELAVIGPGER